MSAAKDLLHPGIFRHSLIQQGFGASLSMFASILLYLIGAPVALLGGVLSDRFGGCAQLQSWPAVIGTTAPLVATWLEARTGAQIAFGWYMTVLCIVSSLTAAFAYPARLIQAWEE